MFDILVYLIKKQGGSHSLPRGWYTILHRYNTIQRQIPLTILKVSESAM